MSYAIVWTPSLTVAQPIIHAVTWPHPEKIVDRDGPDPTTITKSLTDCRRGVIAEWWTDDQGLITYVEYRGSHLYSQHARALPAHWCRLCWPVTS